VRNPSAIAWFAAAVESVDFGDRTTLDGCVAKLKDYGWVVRRDDGSWPNSARSRQ
jgi:hypothetical protein